MTLCIINKYLSLLDAYLEEETHSIYNALHFKDKELLDNLKSYNFVNPKDTTSLNSRGMVTNAYQQVFTEIEI